MSENVLNSTSAKQHSILRLVGMPPPSTTDTPNNASTPGLASSPEALAFNQRAFPTLLKAELAATKCIDTVDATSEDPFTLESFEDMIQKHHEVGKDFIIARVYSIDDNDRIYTSYYSAHALLKVLFRTQPNEGLLHRMKATNPLNGLKIANDVHFYRIRIRDPEQNPLAKMPSKDVDAVIMSTVNQISIDNEEAEMNKLSTDLQMMELRPQRLYTRRSSFIADSPSSLSDMTHSISVTAFDDSYRSRTESSTSIAELRKWADELPKIQSTASVSSDDEPKPAAPLEFTAHYYATDDDYLMRRFVREYFKQHSVNDEDVFLFTLFSPNSGEPLVSDPTDPNAIAQTVNEAVKQYRLQLRVKNAASTVPRGDTFTSLRSGTVTGSDRWWSRVRASLITPTVATSNQASPNRATPPQQTRSLSNILNYLFGRRSRAMGNGSAISGGGVVDESGIPASPLDSDLEMQGELPQRRFFFDKQWLSVMGFIVALSLAIWCPEYNIFFWVMAILLWIFVMAFPPHLMKTFPTASDD